MAWQLTIYQIDVGQGDCALIVAEDVPGGLHRTMLIDGGLQMYARTIHNFVASILGPRGYNLDFILVSHYDRDHYGGIMGLLNADNMRRVAEVVSDAVTTAATNPARTTTPQRVACGALAAAATIFGAYGINAGQIATMCNNMAPHVGGGWTNEEAGTCGFDWANNFTVPNLLTPPLRVGAIARQRELAFDAGVAAAFAIDRNLPVLQTVAQFVFAFMTTTVGDESSFDTGGRYRNVCILDTGPGAFQPPEYLNAITGRYMTPQDLLMIAPGINRLRLTPALGAEFLWNMGPAPINAPANSPAMFCVARLGYLWQGIGNAPLYIGNNNTNDIAIGSVIRFGNFYFYTGGDLTTRFEEPLATAIRNFPLPNPQNPAAPFPAPPRIAAFKCGHHGSTHSTSQNYLNTMNAVTTMISCGRGQYQNENFPSPVTTHRLQGHGSINRYYLTNCSYGTADVPASNGNDQLLAPGNKSRVAGQNDRENLDPARSRGNITLFLTQNESVGFGGPQQFRVTYFDDDDNMGVPWGFITDVLPF
jgi:hypothetical protein